MAYLFRRAFLWHLENDQVSIPEISRSTGVSAQKLHKLKQGKSQSTMVEDAVLVASFFGKTMEDFLSSAKEETYEEAVSMISKMPIGDLVLLQLEIARQIAERDV